MAKYYGEMIITAEFRERSAVPAGDAVKGLFLNAVRSEGLTPVSDVTLDWREITQAHVDAYLNAHLPEGLTVAPWRVGDWRVRCILDVAEDAPDPALD